MSNSVNIPDSIKEIKQSIARRITILAEWQTKLAKTRKHSLRISRQLQVDATRQQIAELRQALKVAQEKAQVEKAKAFVASLAPVRKMWDEGLFDEQTDWESQRDDAREQRRFEEGGFDEREFF